MVLSLRRRPSGGGKASLSTDVGAAVRLAAPCPDAQDGHGRVGTAEGQGEIPEKGTVELSFEAIVP